MPDTDRRTFLQAAAAGGAALLIARPTRAGQYDGDQKVICKGFKVEIGGMYAEVPGVLAADAGKVKVQVLESTQGDQPEASRYTYGQHEYEDFTMTVQQGPGNVKLQEWAKKAMQVGGLGDALRRDVKLFVYARDRTTILRTTTCFSCLPVGIQAGSHGTAGDIKTFTLNFNVDRVEVA